MKCKIKTDSLDAGYGRNAVVRDISLNVRGGEITALVGPNGSGKSTILKTLAGELKKLGGTVYINGADDEKITMRQRAREISALLTERARTGIMTCREVIETGRYPYTGYFGILTERDREAVNEAIELTETKEFAERDFSAVSDGQRQRVMLARAICQEPQILILDEPTSYLDIHHKIAFIEILKRIVSERGAAVIMSMHEYELAAKTADYAVCVKEGRVFAMGRADETLCGETIRELFDISEEMFKKYIL